MSTELDLIKKIVSDGLLVDAVELPTPVANGQVAVVDDVKEALARFDADQDHAHFVIRVKRSRNPLPKVDLAAENDPQISINLMVDETLEMSEKIGKGREIGQREEIEEDPVFLLENARLLESSNDFPLARNIYLALVRNGQMIPQALAGMASTYEKEGDSERAIRYYQEAIAYKSDYGYYQALAAIQIRVGNDVDAAETLTFALGMPNLDQLQKFEIHKSLGNSYTRLAQYQKAEHHYRAAYEINQDSDALQVNVGSLALQKSDYTAAETHFEKALELNAKNDKAICGLGMVFLGRGSIEKAYEAFVRGLSMNPSNLGAIYNLVRCAYDLKKFDDAATILARYITENPVNTNILYSYAGILFHQGSLDKARAEAEKILSGNPSHSGAKELLELISLKA